MKEGSREEAVGTGRSWLTCAAAGSRARRQAADRAAATATLDSRSSVDAAAASIEAASCPAPPPAPPLLPPSLNSSMGRMRSKAWLLGGGWFRSSAHPGNTVAMRSATSALAQIIISAIKSIMGTLAFASTAVGRPRSSSWWAEGGSEFDRVKLCPDAMFTFHLACFTMTQCIQLPLSAPCLSLKL